MVQKTPKKMKIPKKPKLPADVKKMDRSSALESRYRDQRYAEYQKSVHATSEKAKIQAWAKMEFYEAKAELEKARRKVIQVKHQ
jgi:hypothetical protein